MAQSSFQHVHIHAHTDTYTHSMATEQLTGNEQVQTKCVSKQSVYISQSVSQSVSQSWCEL